MQQLDFNLNIVSVKESKMDMSNVQSGCWGDDGSDYANVC